MRGSCVQRQRAQWFRLFWEDKNIKHRCSPTKSKGTRSTSHVTEFCDLRLMKIFTDHVQRFLRLTRWTTYKWTSLWQWLIVLASSGYITSVNTSSVDAQLADVISKQHISVLKYRNDRVTVPNIDQWRYNVARFCQKRNSTSCQSPLFDDRVTKQMLTQLNNLICGFRPKQVEKRWSVSRLRAFCRN